MPLLHLLIPYHLKQLTELSLHVTSCSTHEMGSALQLDSTEEFPSGVSWG